MDSRSTSPRPFYARVPAFATSLASLASRVPTPTVFERDNSYFGSSTELPSFLDLIDDVRYKPDRRQLIETLKVVVMNLDYNQSIPPQYNTSVTHLLEHYYEIITKYEPLEKEAQEAREEAEKAKAELAKRSEEWELLEKSYKEDLKNLELLLCTKESGMEGVLLQRSKSSVRRTKAELKLHRRFREGVSGQRRQSQASNEAILVDAAEKRDSNLSKRLKEETEYLVANRPKISGYSTSSSESGDDGYNAAVPELVLPSDHVDEDAADAPRPRSPLSFNASRALAFLTWGKKKSGDKAGFPRDIIDSSESSESDDGSQVELLSQDLQALRATKSPELGRPASPGNAFLMPGRALMQWGRKKSSTAVPQVTQDEPIVPVEVKSAGAQKKPPHKARAAKVKRRYSSVRRKKSVPKSRRSIPASAAENELVQGATILQVPQVQDSPSPFPSPMGYSMTSVPLLGKNSVFVESPESASFLRDEIVEDMHAAEETRSGSRAYEASPLTRYTLTDTGSGAWLNEDEDEAGAESPKETFYRQRSLHLTLKDTKLGSTRSPTPNANENIRPRKPTEESHAPKSTDAPPVTRYTLTDKGTGSWSEEDEVLSESPTAALYRLRSLHINLNDTTPNSTPLPTTSFAEHVRPSMPAEELHVRKSQDASSTTGYTLTDTGSGAWLNEDEVQTESAEGMAYRQRSLKVTLKDPEPNPAHLPAANTRENIRPRKPTEELHIRKPQDAAPTTGYALTDSPRSVTFKDEVQPGLRKTTLTRYQGSVKNTRRPSERRLPRLPRTISEKQLPPPPEDEQETMATPAEQMNREVKTERIPSSTSQNLLASTDRTHALRQWSGQHHDVGRDSRTIRRVSPNLPASEDVMPMKRQSSRQMLNEDSTASMSRSSSQDLLTSADHTQATRQSSRQYHDVGRESRTIRRVSPNLPASEDAMPMKRQSSRQMLNEDSTASISRSSSQQLLASDDGIQVKKRSSGRSDREDTKSRLPRKSSQQLSASESEAPLKRHTSRQSIWDGTSARLPRTSSQQFSASGSDTQLKRRTSGQQGTEGMSAALIAAKRASAAEKKN